MKVNPDEEKKKFTYGDVGEKKEVEKESQREEKSQRLSWDVKLEENCISQSHPIHKKKKKRYVWGIKEINKKTFRI